MTGPYDSKDAARFISAHGSFIVLGHKEPDGDCIASQMAAAFLVRALGKEASLHSVGPFDRPEIATFADLFSSTVSVERREGAAVIIVDCSTPDRTGALGRSVAGLPCLVIDHHSSGEPFGDARMVDATCPSTTMLLFALFEAMGVAPDADIARLLLFGLCTDTGFFRHLAQSGPETFEALSRLVQRGTSTAEVYMMVYGRRELSARKLLGEMLTHAESHLGDALIITWQTIEERTRLAAWQRGEDDLYRLLQTVKGNVVVAQIKEEREGAYSVGLRSTSAVDVGVLAASFGGGGHKQAAGFDMSGTLESVKQAVLDKLLPVVTASLLQNQT
jgi:bifunctional oligoribonuclease and PAP phosphatase NrnA